MSLMCANDSRIARYNRIIKITWLFKWTTNQQNKKNHPSFFLSITRERKRHLCDLYVVSFRKNIFMLFVMMRKLRNTSCFTKNNNNNNNNVSAQLPFYLHNTFWIFTDLVKIMFFFFLNFSNHKIQFTQLEFFFSFDFVYRTIILNDFKHLELAITGKTRRNSEFQTPKNKKRLLWHFVSSRINQLILSDFYFSFLLLSRSLSYCVLSRLAMFQHLKHDCSK